MRSIGKRYIVEIGRLERLYKAFINGNGKPNLTWLSPEIDLTPYVEPDLEQVKRDYDAWYEKGLSDAWEAARKIADMPYGDGEKIFGVGGWHIIEKCTADEVIEELKAREQAQKEEKPISAEEVMRQYLDIFCKSSRCGECILDTSDFTCGRGYHFLISSSVSDEEVRKAYVKVVKEKG